jgi:pyridoxamine 5'-phosphate oxidase
MERDGLFAGDDPFEIARSWLAEAEKSELNDPNAVALSTVDDDGLPNVRMVLLKEISEDGFIFYTNYNSAKGRELTANPKAAMVLHWKSLRRQVRIRGMVSREEGTRADEYYASRSLKSRLGAWASEQSQPLDSRGTLMAKVAKITAQKGPNPPRPPFWGGFKIAPVEIEFWADGAFRLHDRFVWRRARVGESWKIQRLNP